MKKRLTPAIACMAALILSACTTTPEQPATQRTAVEFEPVEFSTLAAIDPADWSASLEAFRRSCSVMKKQPVWTSVCEAAQAARAQDAHAFFEQNFRAWQVAIVQYLGDEELSRKYDGLMTGYYEPLLHGSRTKRAPFVHPIYGVPDDLLVIDLASLYPELKGKRLRGKLNGRRVVPYDTRGEIQNRKDMDRWAIAWVDDPIEAFFLHIQGSGRIMLPDGSCMRVGFADQNGRQYRSIGKWLAVNGKLKPHELSMQRIRRWAKEHPAQTMEALAQNPSYVFFEERTGDSSLGPVGAQLVPLTPKASVAVDPRFWRYGTPFIVSASQENPALGFTRPVIAQDTGGAIKGALRFDYFWGFGDEAGEAAGRQRSAVSAIMLAPLGVDPDELMKR